MEGVDYFMCQAGLSSAAAHHDSCCAEACNDTAAGAYSAEDMIKATGIARST